MPKILHMGCPKKYPKSSNMPPCIPSTGQSVWATRARGSPGAGPAEGACPRWAWTSARGCTSRRGPRVGRWLSAPGTSVGSRSEWDFFYYFLGIGVRVGRGSGRGRGSRHREVLRRRLEQRVYVEETRNATLGSLLSVILFRSIFLYNLTKCFTYRIPSPFSIFRHNFMRTLNNVWGNENFNNSSHIYGIIIKRLQYVFFKNIF